MELRGLDAATGQIRVCCTIAEFGKLDLASQTMPLEGGGADPDIRDQNQLQFRRSAASQWLADPPSVTCDTLPSGEIAVRGGDHVHATDGAIGQIQGLVIDSGSHQVTHVLLHKGHMLGRKIVAVPIGAVTGVSQDGFQLNITKQQVKDLPSGWHRSPG